MPKSFDTDLKQLLEKINAGKIQLPEFQRSWLWNDERIRKIISSLTQGLSDGRIMNLEYGSASISF